jgi:hypothetical protein
MQIKTYAINMDTFAAIAKEAKFRDSRYESATETVRRLIMERNMYRSALYSKDRAECLRVESLMRGERPEDK